jgi:hypothetical protein
VVEIHLVEKDGRRESFGVGRDVGKDFIEVGGVGKLADGEAAAGVKGEASVRVLEGEGERRKATHSYFEKALRFISWRNSRSLGPFIWYMPAGCQGVSGATTGASGKSRYFEYMLTCRWASKSAGRRRRDQQDIEKTEEEGWGRGEGVKRTEKR